MQPLTIGVEEEFLLVGDDGQLARSGPSVIRDSDDEPAGELQEEMNRCMVESATGVCVSPGQLVTQLGDLRAELASTAAAKGLRLLPCGTPLLNVRDSVGEVNPRPRYERIAEMYGGIAHVAMNCACHVHIGIAERETAVQVSNRLRPWLPALLTLTANSPFAEGADSGYSSWRYVQASLWPTAGPPPVFESLAHYEDSVETMLTVGAALDRGMVYWDVRLSDNQPTIEVRVNDVAATPDEAALLAIIVRGLVAVALRDIEDGVPLPPLRQELLRAYLWRAAHDGLSGHCPHPLTGRLESAATMPAVLFDHVRPLLSEEDVEFVAAGLRELERSGGGAHRQRAAFAVNHKFTDVVDDLAWAAPR